MKKFNGNWKLIKRLKLKNCLKDLERAYAYLQIAGEATRRLSNHLKALARYDEAKEDLEPWTWILTKEDAIKRVRDTQAAYARCMEVYEKFNKMVI